MIKNKFKITSGLLSILALMLVVSSCFDDPEFPNEPRITFNSIIYKDRASTGAAADSLLLVINFEDGDGDLGLGPDENNTPYQERNYFSNKTGRLLDFQNETSEDVLSIGEIGEIDSLPEYENNPRACLFWDINPQIDVVDPGTGDIIPLPDTAYYQLNERHNNIFIRFYNDLNNDGEIDEENEEFDWSTINLPTCSGNYDGRFPILSDDLSDSSPLEGTISRGMIQGVPFSVDAFLGNRLTKLRVYIMDRAGNRSNVIETPEFRLNDIRGN